MSRKHEETASEIPSILNDYQNKTTYERLRFFGKVKTVHIYFIIRFFFCWFFELVFLFIGCGVFSFFLSTLLVAWLSECVRLLDYYTDKIANK